MSYNTKRYDPRILERRKFLKLGSASILGAGLTVNLVSCSTKAAVVQAPKKGITIQEAIDIIMAQIPAFKKGLPTVDTIKIGDGTQEIKGIVTTFMATIEVIEKTIELGANFIITHEPTFYNHLDETDWLQDDKVYQNKKQLLEKNNIVVWRFHDFWHLYRPDGILTGFLQKLEWTDYLNPDLENTVAIPAQSLRSLAAHIKSKFNLKRTFFIGDENMQSTRIGILPGAWGGRAHIPFLGKDIDTLLVGESQEWEAVEYIRDAAHVGMKKGLIIMGHAESEDPGMRYCAEWIAELIPAIPAIHHVSAGDPFIPV